MSKNQQNDPHDTSQEGWEHAILIDSTSDVHILETEIAENQTCNASKKANKFFKPLKKLKTWAELIGLAVLIWYAYTTRNLWIESQSQTKIAEAGNRPWIKITDVTLTHLPDFETLRFINMPLANGTHPAASIQTVITIKNIGKGMAQNVSILPNLMFYKWNSGVSLYEEQKRICDKSGTWNPGAPFVWSAVFPDEPRVSPIGTFGFYDTDMAFHPADRPGDWISGTLFVCVSYQSPLPYRTSVAFALMGKTDRFVEVGKPINDPEIHLLRDQRSEYAQ